MTYLLSGSFAYDTILSIDKKLTEEEFEKELKKLKDNKLNHALFGGTGGNIAYNSSLLKDSPMLIASLGKLDSDNYLNWLRKNNLKTETLTNHENETCPHIWIVTDKENNQVSNFHMGAMNYHPSVPDKTPDLWHLAPDNPNFTSELASLAVKQRKEYFFDPGQALKYFISKSFKQNYFNDLIRNAKGIFVNNSEWELLKNHLNLTSPFDLLKKDQFLVKTLGEKGVALYLNNKETILSGVKSKTVVDPTGCGDAFRAGFIHKYVKGSDLISCLELGLKMGAITVSKFGGQNHTLED
jgi:adenosine kinase